MNSRAFGIPSLSASAAPPTIPASQSAKSGPKACTWTMCDRLADHTWSMVVRWFCAKDHMYVQNICISPLLLGMLHSQVRCTCTSLWWMRPLTFAVPVTLGTPLHVVHCLSSICGVGFAQIEQQAQPHINLTSKARLTWILSLYVLYQRNRMLRAPKHTSDGFKANGTLILTRKLSKCQLVKTRSVKTNDGDVRQLRQASSPSLNAIICQDYLQSRKCAKQNK